MKKQSVRNFFSNDKQFQNLKIGTKFGFERRVEFKDIKNMQI